MSGTLIDPNITFSPQACDLAVGAAVGFAGASALIISVLSKVGAFFLAYYLIKRITEIWISKKDPKKKRKT